MRPLLEKIYFHSPVPVQNLLVSAYGLKLRRERYNRRASSFLEALKQSERYSADEMLRLQSERFVAIARHAIVTVPHFRDWAAAEGVSAYDIKSLGDLELFPILEKDQVRECPDRFISDSFRKGKLILLNTSGTSGKPLDVYCDADARTYHYAFFSRLRGWFGISAKSRRATFFGRIIQSAGNERPPFWRHDLFQRNILMSSYHLAPKNLKYYYDELVKYAPDEIIGYPSSLFQIAKFIITEAMPPLKPRVVFTTAETLLSHEREILEQAFLCPVVDQYGCTEMAFFASQCECGTMHFHPEHGLAEVVNDGGFTTGDNGALVATGFVNPVMPLIRYRVGDVVSLDNLACDCGRAFPVLRSVCGRLDDVLVRPDGTPIGRLDPIFKGQAGVYETQIIQPAKDLLVFKIVRDGKFTRDLSTQLLYEVEKRVGADMKIRFDFVKAIPKDRNGKFKAVVKQF
jgi:Coenzyme F390 synthetase